MSKKRRSSKPSWLQDFRTRLELIELFDLAFEIECDCELVKRMQKLAQEYGRFFTMPPMPGVRKRKR